MSQLHLSSPADALPPCPRKAPSPSFSPASVHAFLQQPASKGSAPGLSGWTDALLLPLAEAPQSLLALTALLEDIASGRIDSNSRARLLSCRLIPARKKDDGVRPIAVSEIFLRAASALSLQLLPSGTESRLLAPIQLGVGSVGLRLSFTGFKPCLNCILIMFY